MSLEKNLNKVSYKSLTIGEKREIIEQVESGRRKIDVAKEFGIPASTLSTFLKNKGKIMLLAPNCEKNRKRARAPENPDLDECVLKWFKQGRDKKIPLSGTTIRAKAEEFATGLGKNTFKASTGWLDNFKGRNNIVLKTACGESGSVDVIKVNQWKFDLPGIIAGVEPANIFNVDETGLFFKCTPSKTLAFKGEHCSGGKLSKERVTILVGANMAGTEKLPLLMIGKAKNPRCFKNVRTKPVEYQANTKAWMTADIFEDWLISLDKRFRKEKRKILLFIDNCTAHKRIPELSNVRVIFFPANMTSVIQPMDQGIIKNLKDHYRRLLVQKLVDEDNNASISILDAARMCSAAWDQVSENTIKNCFKKAGFGSNEVDISHESSEEHDDFVPNPDFENFVNIDEDLAVCGEETDAEILASVLESQAPASDEEDVSGQEIEDEPVPTAVQAMAHIAKLRRFIEAQANIDQQIFKSLNKIEKIISQQRETNLKQTKISNFFQ